MVCLKLWVLHIVRGHHRLGCAKFCLYVGLFPSSGNWKQFEIEAKPRSQHRAVLSLAETVSVSVRSAGQGWGRWLTAHCSLLMICREMLPGVSGCVVMSYWRLTTVIKLKLVYISADTPVMRYQPIPVNISPSVSSQEMKITKFGLDLIFVSNACIIIFACLIKMW